MFVQVIKIKLHGNPSRGNCSNSCRQTDITKLRGAVCDYANSNKHTGSSEICVSGMVFMKYYEGVLVPWLNYPAWKSHLFYAMFYCYLWPAWIYNRFSHNFIKSTIFRNLFLATSLILIFSATAVWSTSYSNKNSARYDHKRKHVFT